MTEPGEPLTIVRDLPATGPLNGPDGGGVTGSLWYDGSCPRH